MKILGFMLILLGSYHLEIASNLLTQGDLKVFQQNQAPPWSLKNVGDPGRKITLKDYAHSNQDDAT